MLYHSVKVPSKKWLAQLRKTISIREGAILLDTPESYTHQDHKHYSFFAFEPEKLLKVQQGKFQTLGFELEQKLDAFDGLRYLFDLYPKPSQTNQLPFEGGLMGYLGYHLENERKQSYLKNDLKLPELWMGYYTVALVYSRDEQQLHIVGIENQQLKADQLLLFIKNSSKSALEDFTLCSDWQNNMSQSQYIEKFNQVKKYLQNGDCYQINLAQRWNAQYQGDPWTVYQMLCELNSAPYSAFVNISPDQQVLSLSPEQFVQCQPDPVNHHKIHCQTKPIKGTTARSTDLKVDQQSILDLAHSAKDQSENVMIVDLLRNDFSKVCEPHSVEVTQLFEVETYPAVHHLVSTVEGLLEEPFDAIDLLQACFPGGSITGAPKIRSMEIIDELEPNGRSVYCGTIGYISANGSMDTNIAIRTLVTEAQQIYCWAGGGLVIDSLPLNEYQETLDKVSAILPAISLHGTQSVDGLESDSV